MIFVLLQPRPVIVLDGRRPAGCAQAPGTAPKIAPAHTIPITACFILRLIIYIAPLSYPLFGSNQVVPLICTVFATSSFISTPKPGLSGGVT